MFPLDTCASQREEVVSLILRIIQMSTEQGMGVLRSYMGENSIIYYLFSTSALIFSSLYWQICILMLFSYCQEDWYDNLVHIYVLLTVQNKSRFLVHLLLIIWQDLWCYIFLPLPTMLYIVSILHGWEYSKIIKRCQFCVIFILKQTFSFDPK